MALGQVSSLMNDELYEGRRRRPAVRPNGLGVAAENARVHSIAPNSSEEVNN